MLLSLTACGGASRGTFLSDLPAASPGPELVDAATVDQGQFDLPAVPLTMRDPGPVELTGVTVCQMAELVLVAELGLRSACVATGTGALSIYSDFSTAEALFALTRSVIEAAGASVTVEDGRVLVAGEAGEDQAGFSAPPPLLGGGENVQAEQPPAGFTIPAGALDANATRRALVTIDSPSTRFFRGSVEEVQGVADGLGLVASAVQSGNRVLVVASAGALSTLATVLAQSDVDVHSFPADVPAELAASMADEYGVRVLPGRPGYLTVAGQGQALSEFVSAVHALGFRSSQRAVSAAFVFGSQRDLSSLNAVLSGGVDVGDFVVNVGSVQGFSGLVSGLRQSTGIRIVEEPSISVVDGTPAVFLSGREVPVQTEVDVEGRGSVEYRSVGTRLSVATSPRPGGLVRVELQIEVSSVDGAGVQANPTFATRSVNTSVVARPGDLLVISGFSASRSERQSRFSLLGLGGLRDRDDLRLAVFLVVE
jgi:hypothetical protein